MLPLINPNGRLHLIGICGSGMGSLAGMLQQRGFRVTGSDANVYPPMSDFLKKLSIPVASPYAEKNLTPAPDLVVIGNALSRGNPEVEAVLDRRLPYASMAEVLKELFLRPKESIVVSGPHGKTTTASIVAWLLHHGGLAPSFLVGGIAGNFASSFELGEGRHFVVEGDEYDTAFFDKGPKFLHYLPRYLILNSVEYDHADIYPDLDAVLTAFRRLVNLVPRTEKIFAAGESRNARACVANAFCRVEFFGLGEENAWRAVKLKTTGEGTEFDLLHEGRKRGAFFLPMAGEFNVLNAVAATAMADACGLSTDVIREGLRAFGGVRRRMEVRGVEGGITVIDDFAHHPTAIAGAVAAARARYPKGRIWAIVEPRSNTLRRKIFQEELKSAFEDADEVLFAPVHRAEALPNGERLDVAAVVEELRIQGKEAHLLSGVREIVSHAAGRLKGGDTALIMSNGGFEGIHDLLLQALRERPSPNTPAGFASSKPASPERS